ncbi:MAG TPA: DUF4405 domain-containing protein [Tepidisphaeraceae bacterium]|nr:DUF4405 domain-containing protein [Tepidisphaeraceae bacterium]
MKRNTLNLLIDITSAIAAVGLIFTGLIVRYVLPPGTGMRRTLWALNRHEWGDVHFWIAVSLIAIVLFHGLMHWQWICVTLSRSFRRDPQNHIIPSPARRAFVGVLFLLIISGAMAGAVWFASSNVTDLGAVPAFAAERHFEMQAGSSITLQGRMTLLETAHAAGLSVAEVRDRLKLPASVNESDRLGQISQRFGFTVQQARQLLATPDAGH